MKDITFIDGTVYKTKSLESVYDYKMLPDYEALLKDKKEYARSLSLIHIWQTGWCSSIPAGIWNPMMPGRGRPQTRHEPGGHR